MAQESWIEPKSRIPFIGIIAIVLIVAVVAVFVKIELGPLFPKSDIQIQQDNSLTGNAIAGKSSSSFLGLREIELTRKERLEGILNTPKHAVKFVIDVPEQIMTISEGTTTEEVVLSSDGQTLGATFDHNNQLTRVDISLSNKRLLYNEIGKSAVPPNIDLSDMITYEGTFIFKNVKYQFQYEPSSDEVTISGTTTSVIKITSEGSTFSGIWQNENINHPIIINMQEHQATIEDVY